MIKPKGNYIIFFLDLRRYYLSLPTGYNQRSTTPNWHYPSGNHSYGRRYQPQHGTSFSSTPSPWNVQTFRG